ncbi:carbohydrate ABC transporter membrane protein 2 (CUT1 family) [Halanaerobium saccharolyticum]|uniref:Carbohydrate ABC transporter membrane protein 2 (CUT1 family) n=1 Tax=Halanaerobium saccharolyticum TaxID=43595 RepID=A0A4R6LZ80_9FIRM|nr:carbohydrate ABC transporter permease [Halanaerobium saccharolyticum]TDO94123.1 carbohydrate ABC transporter membrane protein 2 (CUT1 family) [Halanaerobium saccharolyticum]
MKKKRFDKDVFRYIFIVIAIALFTGPILWILLSSFKSPNEILNSDPSFFPRNISFENYSALFEDHSFIRFFINSIIVTVISTFLGVLFGTLAAYSFARTNTTMSNLLFVTVMSFRMLPAIVLVIPLFLLMKNLGLLNTYLGLILAYTTFTLPFAIFLMTGFIQQIPRELEESALIDGCSRLQAILKVVFPLAAPGIATTTIFSFLVAWNDYLFAVTLTSTTKVRTLAVGIAGFNTARNVSIGPMFAALVLGVIPLLIVTLFAQKHLIKGLTLGALKG